MVFCWHPHLCSWQIPVRSFQVLFVDLKTLIAALWFSILDISWLGIWMPVAPKHSQTLCSNHKLAFLEDQSIILRRIQLWIGSPVLCISQFDPHILGYIPMKNTRNQTHKKGSGHLFLFHFLLLHNQFLELSSLGDFRTLLKSWTESWENLIVGPPRNRIYMNLHQFNTSHCMTH